MSLVTIISELWRFFVDHIKKLVVWGIVTSLIILGAQYGLSQLGNPEDEEATRYLTEVYSQEPAEFQAVVTLEDGNVFQNSYIFDEYFTTPEILQQVEAETGVDLTKWYKSEQALELLKTNLFRGGIAGIRNTSSGVITFRFLVAPTAEGNLKVAQAFRNILLEAKAIPFMENQKAAIMVEPLVGELLNLEVTPEVPTPETLNIYRGMSPLKRAIFAVAGFILGLILGIVFFFIKRILADDIRYAFEYTWNYDDYYQMVKESKLPMNSLIKAASDHQIIIAEQDIDTVATIPNLAQASLKRDDIEEIVIIVEANKTTKDWYKEQYQFAKYYQIPVQIVHMY